MSEYQYFEFQAVDRLLTRTEMDALRARSTRARITPSSFINEYSWGNFKGDPDVWMERYFDGFFYCANWGQRIFSIRLAQPWPALTAVKGYCVPETMSVESKGDVVLITFETDGEGFDWMDGEGQLTSLLPLRAELARGDLRALYLGWLAGVQSRLVDEKEVEPPVPPGLATLHASHEQLMEVMDIDPSLVAAAAEASPPLQEADLRGQVGEWVAGLSDAEKTDLLVDLVSGNPDVTPHGLLARARRMDRLHLEKAPPEQRRLVAQIVDRSEEIRSERRRIAAEQAAKKRAREERRAAEQRAAYLDLLVGREWQLWDQVQALADRSQASKYAEAVKLLVDLRDLAARSETTDDFERKLHDWMIRNARKRKLMERVWKAGVSTRLETDLWG